MQAKTKKKLEIHRDTKDLQKLTSMSSKTKNVMLLFTIAGSTKIEITIIDSLKSEKSNTTKRKFQKPAEI